MISLRKLSFLILSVPVAAALIFLYMWLNMAGFLTLETMMTVMTITTPTLGTLLAIITAGLMFTQGKFSELVSELNNRSSDYLARIFTFEKIQVLSAHVLALREEFKRLAASTTITEEKTLYERIVAKASVMFVCCAVLINLKMKQQRIPPTDLLISQMDADLYAAYRKRRQIIKRDWQLLVLVKQIIDVWEGPVAILAEKSGSQTPLEEDIRNSVAILKLKETVDKSTANISSKVMTASDALDNEIDKFSRRLHEDRIPQLLSQMKQVNAVRGKYFHLTVTFVAAPLLVNLLVLPLLPQENPSLIQQLISITSMLSIVGVAFLLLYIYKILNV